MACTVLVGSIADSLKQPLPRPSTGATSTPTLARSCPSAASPWILACICGHYQSVPSKKFPPRISPSQGGAWFIYVYLLLFAGNLMKTFSFADPPRIGSNTKPLNTNETKHWLKNPKTKRVRLPSQHFLVAFGVQLLSSEKSGGFQGEVHCSALSLPVMMQGCIFFIRKKLTTTQAIHPIIQHSPVTRFHMCLQDFNHS